MAELLCNGGKALEGPTFEEKKENTKKCIQAKSLSQLIGATDENLLKKK